MTTADDYAAALARARESTRHYPRHEPSVWLRQMAEAAALRTAARGPWREGLSLIVPLIPTWPPPSPDRPEPAHVCARCGAVSPTPRDPDFRNCGMAATSGHVPGVLLKFAFELCATCARREYGPTAAPRHLRAAPDPADPADHPDPDERTDS